jgi:NAD(P)-dependent dehydrogenase (short-subunit alcohol dehydrogenase family)
MLLTGKKVVVVGGSSGIGLSTAELAMREGAEVIIASRNADRLNAVAGNLGARAISADVTSDESVASLFRSCGPVDHVVVTAAQLRTGPFKTVAMEDVRSTMESKFWGAWRVARSAEIRPGGSLTLVSGYLSIRPRPNAAIVGAANGAIESLARSLALELAPVRVNAVSPGIIDTPIRAAMPEAARRDMLAKTAAGLPVGRVGVGEDIARQILAFMTIGFATGSIVYIDGGAYNLIVGPEPWFPDEARFSRAGCRRTRSGRTRGSSVGRRTGSQPRPACRYYIAGKIARRRGRRKYPLVAFEYAARCTGSARPRFRRRHAQGLRRTGRSLLFSDAGGECDRNDWMASDPRRRIHHSGLLSQRRTRPYPAGRGWPRHY